MTDEDKKVSLLESDLFTIAAISRELIKEIDTLEDLCVEQTGKRNPVLAEMNRMAMHALAVVVNRMGPIPQAGSRYMALARVKIDGKETVKVLADPNFIPETIH
jgi:hypothetical protein